MFLPPPLRAFLQRPKDFLKRPTGQDLFAFQDCFLWLKKALIVTKLCQYFTHITI